MKLILAVLVFVLTALPSMGAPIHDATYYGLIAEVRLLIARGADVNARDQVTAATPLQIAIQTTNPDMVLFLLQNGAKTYMRYCHHDKEGSHFYKGSLLSTAQLIFQDSNRHGANPKRERIIAILKQYKAVEDNPVRHEYDD